MATTSRILFAGCIALASGIYAQPPARLTGRVTAEETGKPLAGVTVLATQQISSGRPVILRALTNGDGAYVIDGAPPGSYGLCIHAGTAYLDPCEWGGPVASSPGGASQEIRLRLGIRLVVKLDDASGYAANRDPKKPGSPLAVTVAGASGRERPVPLTSQGGGVYEYSYLTPPDTVLRLRVASNEFLLADASGSAIDERGYVFSVTTPSAVTPPSGRPSRRLPFTLVRFGPPPVLVPVKIRGKKSP
ncbi:MAG: carboxypeptidase-like regulatory domain-containing protein [Acidobacteria bacterium]|nr:carboxypeptidase-like regulatory domain-containing protein [Acidobacteriota bacterium]